MQNLFNSYDENKTKFENDFENCSDFLLRTAQVQGVKCFFAVMDGLIDSLQLSQMIVSPILNLTKKAENSEAMYNQIKLKTVNSLELSEAQTFEDCYYYLMSGFCVFILDGCDKAMVFGIQGWEKRSPDDPTNEANIKGAKECFVESLNDNKAMLRRRVKTHHLKLKQLKIGKAATTPIVIAYIDNRADKKLVEEVEYKIKSACLNTVQDYGIIAAFLDTDINSFFTCVGNTERPDVLASKLLEGRIAVIVDGTPFAIYIPYLFSDSFQAVDDYDNPPFYSSFMRLLKYFCFVLCIFLPGLYVAIGTYHQELIPTNLLFIISTAEMTTPFSLTAEAIMLLFLYEVMREAGLRLPKNIGHAVSIIGGIVIGETAINAGLIGAPMLVIIALTAICSYVIYPLYENVSVLRFIFILAGGLFGIYGIMLGAAALFVNICSLSPFGIPLSSPISPLNKNSIGDIFYREGWKKLSKRAVRVNRFRGVDID